MAEAPSWRRAGRILEAAGGPLARSHAMLPTPLVLADRIRVFFASCDDGMRGRIFFADLDLEPPHAVLGLSDAPVLDIGGPRDFDCDGVNPSQALIVDGRLLLFYIGWRRGPSAAPYTLFAGLAESDDEGLTFRKRQGPLLPATAAEPYFRTAPFVWPSVEGWRMLYIGGAEFFTGSDGRRLPLYGLREARSPDIASWPDGSRAVLAPDQAGGEIGFGRPVLWRGAAGGPVVMLSVRTSDGYRLVQGAADEVLAGRRAFGEVLEGEPDAWESRMTCFGAPCVAGDRELLFYNGDGFGRTGFGLAWRQGQP